MSIKLKIDTFPVAFPSKVAAREGMGHIYSVTADADSWNGMFIAKGDYEALDRYEEGTAGTVSLKVVDKAANGNYYVEVLADVAASTALIVYNVPMIEEEYNNEFKKLSHYYIPAGTEMRAYPLFEGDIWELSVDAFDTSAVETTVSGKTVIPNLVGKTITTITGKKPVIPA